MPSPARTRSSRPIPGGLDVAGESETAFETSAGEDKDSQLDLSKIPEAPVAKPPKPAAEPASPDEPKPAKPEPAPEPKPTGATGSVIQLGAFAEPGAGRARMDRAVGALPVGGGDEQADRARSPAASGCAPAAASPAEAKPACQALKAAGENCFVAQ